MTENASKDRGLQGHRQSTIDERQLPQILIGSALIDDNSVKPPIADNRRSISRAVRSDLSKLTTEIMDKGMKSIRAIGDRIVGEKYGGRLTCYSYQK